MSRIEDALVQEEIADSILDDSNIIATYSNASLGREVERPEPPQEQREDKPASSDFGAHGEHLLDQEIRERADDVIRFGDEAHKEREEQRPPEKESFDINEAVKLTPEEIAELQQQASPEPTSEVARAASSELSRFVQEHPELHPPTETLSFAEKAGPALGGDASSFDIGKLGLVDGKTLTSVYDIARQNGFQFVQLPPVPPAMANEFFHDFMPACKQDANLWEGKADKQLVASTVFVSDYSLLVAIAQNPQETDVRRLVSVENAERALANIYQAFGQDGEALRRADPSAFRQNALNLAYARAEHVRAYFVRRSQTDQQSRQPATPRRTGQRVPKRFREGIKGQPAPKFQSNSDIFNSAAADWQTIHGRL